MAGNAVLFPGNDGKLQARTILLQTKAAPHLSSTQVPIGMTKSLSWLGCQVLVCGGSSGLGLHLVIAAARQNAKIAIVGRDANRLDAARLIALKHGAASVACFSIDLRNCDSNTTDDSAKLAQWLSENDVALLINAIGRSDRGLLEQLNSKDLISLFEDNVLCTWNMIQLALHSLKRSKGSIVNIGSLAGLVSAPNMGGYSIAKFGLTALSRQLRLELAKDNVSVTLVCPGPIERDDSGNRYQSLAVSRGLSNTATAPAGGAKLRMLDPEKLCDKILEAASQRRKELVCPAKAKWLAAIMPIWPNLADRILRSLLSS